MFRTIVFYVDKNGHPAINAHVETVTEAVNWCIDERAQKELKEWLVAGMELPGKFTTDGVYETLAIPLAQSPNWHINGTGE